MFAEGGETARSADVRTLLGPEKELAWKEGWTLRKGRDDDGGRGWGGHRAWSSDPRRKECVHPRSGSAWRPRALPWTPPLGVCVPLELGPQNYLIRSRVRNMDMGGEDGLSTLSVPYNTASQDKLSLFQIKCIGVTLLNSIL